MNFAEVEIGEFIRTILRFCLRSQELRHIVLHAEFNYQSARGELHSRLRFEVVVVFNSTNRFA